MPGPNATKKTAAKAASKPGYGLGLANKGFDLELPSGNTCLAIRPGAQGLIKAGLLDSLDQLTSLVQTDLIDVHNPKVTAEAVKSMQLDMSKLAEGLEMIDRCVAHCVQQPKVWLDEQAVDEQTGEPIFRMEPDGKGGEVRKPVYKPRVVGRIYADDVDLEDKMFIFNWSMGGTADLKSFREQFQAMLGNISAS